ncbi:MAG TPA: zf-HC2 domain-containing protein [Pirellulaceae bacterium]|nr:zf-HC2 domain-containing protein [Pirellulaceae bacterium]
MKIERDEMRACAEYADRLVDLSDGELPDDERQLVELHAAKCVGCRSELARLDASLAVLRTTGCQPVQPILQSSAGLRRTIYYSAALSLVLLLAAGFAAISFFGNDDAPKTARVAPQQDTVRPANDPQSALLDEATILHQIALIEQQARLQASLDLMPKDPWFAEQRAASEELLARFKAAVSHGEELPQDESPEPDGDFDDGDTL